MKNFKLFPILFVLFVALMASDSFADKPYNEVIFDPWPGVSIFNACMGEEVSGDMVMRIVNHYDKNGNLASQHWNVASGVLVGQVSGLIYNPIGANNLKFDVKIQGARTYSEKWLVHAVAPGGHWIKLYIKTRTIINVNGVVTVDWDKTGYTCK